MRSAATPLAGGVERAIVEHGDGHTWQRLSVPDRLPGANHVTLSSVTAISVCDVWAVGLAAKGQKTVPYALHWDAPHGARWTGRNQAPTSYSSISGSSANDIWVIGRSLHGHSLTPRFLLRGQAQQPDLTIGAREDTAITARIEGHSVRGNQGGRFART